MKTALLVAVGLLAIVTSPAFGQQILAKQLVGEWNGHYTCGQGDTGLTLTFSPQTGNSGSMEGVFSFYPLTSSSGAATGSFGFSVTPANDDRNFSGTATHWIKQPAGYVTVDFAGSLAPEGRSLSGQILNSSCGAFLVSKPGARVQPRGLIPAPPISPPAPG